MEALIAILIGILYSTGVYLLLRRSIVKLILGFIFLGNATNLLIFISGGLNYTTPAILTVSETESMADPLPQALILTAIVISFGVVAFLLSLKYKFFKVTGTDDLDELKDTD